MTTFTGTADWQSAAIARRISRATLTLDPFDLSWCTTKSAPMKKERAADPWPLMGRPAIRGVYNFRRPNFGRAKSSEMRNGPFGSGARRVWKFADHGLMGREIEQICRLPQPSRFV